MWTIFCPRLGLYRARDTAHAQWLFQTTEMWSNSVIHNSVTESRIDNQTGTWVGHEKHCIPNTLKVTRSCDVVAKTSNISSKRHSVVEMHLSYRKSMSPERMAGSDCWPEAPKWRFCAWAVKICPNSLIMLSNRHNFSPFVGNRGRWTRRWW